MNKWRSLLIVVEFSRLRELIAQDPDAYEIFEALMKIMMEEE